MWGRANSSPSCPREGGAPRPQGGPPLTSAPSLPTRCPFPLCSALGTEQVLVRALQVLCTLAQRSQTRPDLLPASVSPPGHLEMG